MNPRQALRCFLQEEDAATTLEYAVMLTFIMVAIFSAVQYFGGTGNGLWAANNNELNNKVWNSAS